MNVRGRALQRFSALPVRFSAVRQIRGLASDWRYRAASSKCTADELVEGGWPGRGSDFEFELHVRRAIRRRRYPQATRAGYLQRRIVVIDDNEDAANTMAMVIDAIGGAPFVVYNGEDGVRMVLEHRPEIVLVDLGSSRLTATKRGGAFGAKWAET